MAETVDKPQSQAAARRSFDEAVTEARLAKVRERIRRNFPNARSPLTWRRDTPTRIVSGCGRFHIDKSGEGDAVRYTAVLRPHSIIGNRRYSLEAAKEDCSNHALPLPLEPVQPDLAPVVEREPGSDDE